MAINRDKVLETAQKLVEKKKYDKAVEELRKLVQHDQNDARTLLKIGDLEVKQSRYADAITTYERVGKLYAQQGFALKAIAVYKQIREIIAKHVPAEEEKYGHITPRLADLYQQLGLTSDALAALDEVATRLQRQQRDQEAIEVFRKIVELDPTNPITHLRLAEALSRVNDVDSAVEGFKTAASQLASIGRRDDAIKVLERLLHHRPDYEQARICAELYLARGHEQDGMQALAKLQLCFQANPRDFDTLSLLARAFNAIGQGGKAIEVQKEMARVARDAGKTDLFREIVVRLVRVAPHDSGVRKLASQSGAVGAAAPPYGAGAAPPPEPPPGANQAPSGPFPQAPPQQYGQQQQQQYGQQQQEHGAPRHPRYGQPQQQHRYQQQPQPQYGQPQEQYGQQEQQQYGQQEQQPYGQQQQQYGQPSQQYGQQQPHGAPQSWQHGQPPEQHYGAPRPQYGQPPQPPHGAPDARPHPPHPESFSSPQRVFTTGPMASQAAARTQGSSDDEIDELSYEEIPEAEILHAEDAAPPRHYGAGQAFAEQAYGDAAGAVPAHTDASAYDEAAARAYAQAEYEGEGPVATEVTDEGDLGEQIQRLISDATSFRRVRLYDQALETLRVGLELDPHSMDLHEVYRDVLIEAGLTEQAVQEMLAIASLYVDALDGESAARALQDVLAFDPQNARAVEMLQELGYEIVDESEDVAEQPDEASTAVGGRAYVQEEAVQTRLPSYDIEDVHPAEVPTEHPDDRQVSVGGSHAPEGFDGGALPSFPLDEPADELSQTMDAGAGEAARTAADAPMPVAAASRSPAPPGIELEDALDEAEFFCSRGLFDDARAILGEQLATHPNHPLLRERLAELDAQEAQRGSGAREKPREQDRAFDIAASLDALESLDYGEGAPQPAGFAEQDEQVDVEEVFAKFKEGVAKQISVDDSDSHYNLGIAYKEMMLIDDAIREFEVAAQDPKRECVCRSMIGMIEIERGRMNEAIDAFLQGLNAPIKDPQQETVLCYEIGSAYEAKKVMKDALSYFQKAMRRDPNYRDVQERVRRLAKSEPKQPARAAAGADDEFDRAFDDLLSKP